MSEREVCFDSPPVCDECGTDVDLIECELVDLGGGLVVGTTWTCRDCYEAD